MKNLDPIFDYSELIAKKIMGKLTDQENELFDQWLSSSGRNQKLWERIKDNHNFQIRNEQFESIDTREAWVNLAENLNLRRKKKQLNVFLKYAAAIILPLLVGTMAYWYVKWPSEQHILAQSDIRPGSRNACLVLNDGQSINLDSLKAKSLKEVDGTVIDKTNDELNYSTQQTLQSNKVLKNTLVVPRGGEYSLVLSDGTKVFVNSMSKLVFPVRFSGDKREVILEGEAYFEVKEDQLHPFIVNVNGIQVNVLGTSFNVKAYEEEENIYTTLVEGKVRITGDKVEKDCILNPDQQVVLNKLNAEVSVQNVDARLYMQWTRGKYTFSNQSLDEIMRTLSRWYDLDYQYQDESIKTIVFEGGLNKYESIDPILDIIRSTGKVKIKVQGKEIVFFK